MRTLFSSRLTPLTLLSIGLGLAPLACDSSDDDGGSSADPAEFPNYTCADVEGECIEIAAGDTEALQEAANSLEGGETLILAKGTYELSNQVTLRAEGITFKGQGMDDTLLDFGDQAAQSNGVDSVGDDFVIEDLTVLDAKKDGLRVEDSDGVTIRRVRATWTNEEDSNNGSYGLYPVKVSHVLVEDSEAYNSSDAGIYVGQCQHAIVRNNLASGNVAGIEIENTQFADVYGNLAEHNTAGLVMFDLPGNPVIGHDVSIHDNTIIDNNTTNFAPGGTVAAFPPGTGTVGMASRRSEIFNNTYANNDTMDVAIVSGLVIESNEDLWALSTSELVGTIEGVDLETEGDTVWNYRSDNVYVHDNTHSNTGTNPTSSGADPDFGLLLAFAYAGNDVDEILYGGIGESMFSATDPEMNSNDNAMCLAGPDGVRVANLNIEVLSQAPNFNDIFRPEPPFAPYDCDSVLSGPVVAPDMPDM